MNEALLKIIKRYHLSISSITERIRIQKTIYLLKQLGFPGLRYAFSFYIYGPYSNTLAKDVFAIFGEEDNIKNLNLNLTKEEESVLKKFDKITTDFTKKSSFAIESQRLEMLSDITYLNNSQKKEKEDVFETIAKKHSYLDKRDAFDLGWNILRKNNLIS